MHWKKHNLEFKNGLTVRQLKTLIENWPEINEFTGEECEVWSMTGKGLSSQVTRVVPLNLRYDHSVSADLLFDSF